MIVPSDLTDETALRNFLQQLADSTGTSILTTSQSDSSVDTFTPGESYLSQTISNYIKQEVSKFEDSLNATFNTFDTNFKSLYGITLEEKVANLEAINNLDSDVSANTLLITDVNTRVNNTEDEISAANTKIDINESAIQDVSTNLTTNYALTSVISSTYATQDQVGALYSVSVEADGHVSGYTAVATGDTSTFSIYAEKFAISSSATGEGYEPFQIDTTNHKINMTSDVAIDGNLLVAGTVAADKINTADLVVTKGVEIATGNVVISSSAAGTNDYPNIEGCYIKGGTIDGTVVNATNILNFSSVRVFSSIVGNIGQPLYINPTVSDRDLEYDDIYDSVTYIGKSNGSGFDSKRICTSDSYIAITMCQFDTDNLQHVSIQKSTNGGSWVTLITKHVPSYTYILGNIEDVDTIKFRCVLDDDDVTVYVLAIQTTLVNM